MIRKIQTQKKEEKKEKKIKVDQIQNVPQFKKIVLF